MHPASLKGAFLFGKSVCRKIWGYTTSPWIHLATICKRPHSKIPHGCLTMLRCLSTCHHGKIIKLTKSTNFPRHGLRILVTISEPFDIFKWGPLLHMTGDHWPWSRVNIKNLEIKVTFLLGKSVRPVPLPPLTSGSSQMWMTVGRPPPLSIIMVGKLYWWQLY